MCFVEDYIVLWAMPRDQKVPPPPPRFTVLQFVYGNMIYFYFLGEYESITHTTKLQYSLA